MPGCGRKDVNRRGEIKLRGEKPVNMSGKDAGDFLQKGRASWYGHPFHGRKTSNGETYNMWGMTAAHKTIPFGTWVRVVNMDNQAETTVRINDRGPFIQGRVIDLSRKAAEAIGMIRSGTANIRLYLADGPRGTNTPPRNTQPTPQPSISATVWTIQVASFQRADKAVELADQLATSFSGIRIEKANGNFRVRIGQFKTKTQAQRVARDLENQGYETWITQKL